MKLHVTVDNVEVELHGTFIPASAGSIDESPTDADFEIDKAFIGWQDVTDFLTDDQYERIIQAAVEILS